MGRKPASHRVVDSDDAVALEHVVEHFGEADRQRHDHDEPEKQCDTGDLAHRQPTGQRPSPVADPVTHPRQRRADDGGVGHPVPEPPQQASAPGNPNRRPRKQYERTYGAGADRPETASTGSIRLVHVSRPVVYSSR